MLPYNIWSSIKSQKHNCLSIESIDVSNGIVNFINIGVKQELY